MKKVKVILASVAFISAIGTTYAFKKLPRTLFIQQTPSSCVAIACHEDVNDVNPSTGLPENCPITATKFRTQSANGQTCSNQVTTATYKQFN